MSKENTTLSIDGDIKLAFKLSCIVNNVEMSETVETFMQNYSFKTKQLRNEG